MIGPPGKFTALVDLGKVDACPLLGARRGHLQHPGGRVQPLLDGRHTLDALPQMYRSGSPLRYLGLGVRV